MMYKTGGRLAMLSLDPDQPDLVYAFDVESLINLKASNDQLEGHPAKDLPDRDDVAGSAAGASYS